MVLPEHPVTLSAEQLRDLNHKLSVMRHDIRNNLALMVAAIELMQLKPQTAERMLATLAEQPSKITEALQKFSAEFEQATGITRS